MRYLLVFSLFLTNYVVWGQTDFYSVYFKSSKVEGGKSLSVIEKNVYGNYRLDEDEENILRSSAGDRLIVDETGIYIAKNKLLSISRTEIRENPDYTIRDGYLHGVVSNDSVLTALEDELYYFLIPAKTYLYETGNTDFSLYQGLLKSDYIVLSKEPDNIYTALYIQFNAGKIALQEIDLENDIFDLRKVQNITKSESNPIVYHIKPSSSEWKKIMSCFSTYDTYSITALD